MTDRPALHALAEACGVARAYLGYDGTERVAPDATCEALLHALGIDASSEQLAQAARQALQAEAALRPLPAVHVVRAGSPQLTKVSLRLPEGMRGRLGYTLELTLEEGASHALSGTAEAEGESLLLPMPGATELSFGYHGLRCRLERDGETRELDQTLIVAPSTCLRLEELIGERRAPGAWGHVYSLRSRHSWGIGDLGDLNALVRWAGDAGLELVGINPLHATFCSAGEVNPYYPMSRLYREPLYLDVMAVLERAGVTAQEARALTAALGAAQPSAPPHVDYPRVLEAKRRALEAAYRAFALHHRGKSSELGRAYAAYRSREGEALRVFATFCALRDALSADDPRCSDYRAWPEPLRDPRRPAVAAFAHEHADAVDFHAYLQFELEHQLRACRRAARGCGMSIGLYGDLALGDAPASADVWARPSLYARGVQIGAPPDAYSDRGQNWGLIPFNPLALHADRYRALSALLRQAFRHVGALRIDHVMGLLRQFWVPEGAPASEGAYVRFPFEDLAGVLALESRRAGALVVGEDLGVVPDGLRERMRESAMLRSQVLYFEHESASVLRHPRDYARAAFATVGTHDLPTLAGFFQGRDLLLRRRAGNIESDEALARALAQREQAKAGLLSLLRAEGLLPAQPEDPSIEALTEAVYVLLAGAESRLIGLALDDLTLERDGLNLPAATLPEQPNWSRRSSLSLEQLAVDARIARLVRLVTERARQP